MAGGLLNLVSGGSQNAIMYGNPQKTYWSSTYKQITNFGMQNFRLEYEGLRQLQLNTDTIYSFKIKRLLMERSRGHNQNLNIQQAQPFFTAQMPTMQIQLA
jgi:hypothetical protein